jgi:MFS family permease
LFVARIVGGVSAGLAYPTTLALVTALWTGPARIKSIALWSSIGGGIASLGLLVADALLANFWWGSVFLITLPLAVVALVMAWLFVPSHVHFAPVPNKDTLTLGLAAIAVAALIAFVLRQFRARSPLYDLHVAKRRTFWVAACAGIIVFGSLMAAAFVSQQYLQNVLGYSTFEAGAAFLPAIVFMVLVAPRSAVLVGTRGAGFTLLLGYAFLFLAFGSMLLLWKQDSHYWEIGITYALIGVGVGLAGTPASHSLTGSVPVQRAGMASGTADLQRDLGGAVLQSIFGALLTAGYAASFKQQIAAESSSEHVSTSVQNQLTKSFAGAEETAQQYPQYSQQILSAARSSFLDGADWAYAAGIIAVLLGAVLVYFFYPSKKHEAELLAACHAADTDGTGTRARSVVRPKS